MANFKENNLGVGFNNALQGLAPRPIVARRNPAGNDSAAEGQIWVNELTQATFICAGSAAGVFTWNNTAGAAFTGANLTVNPGPSVLNGDFSVTSTTGSVGTIRLTTNGAVTETIDILNTQGTATDAITITAQAGGLDLISASAGADSILLDASGVAGGVTLNSGTGGITFTTTGALTFNPGTATALVVAVGDLDLTATTGGVNITGGIAAINAIDLDASDVAGGIQITSGTGGFNQVTTGAIVLQSDLGASLTDAGGAGVDITVQSTAGSILINAGEAVADAINVDSTGGLDVDVALQMNLTSSQNAADAIRINASAGGIDIDAAGAAGEDIDIANAAGSINLSPGEADANALSLQAALGGINVDAALQINIASSQNAADALRFIASAGGIDIDAVGAAGEDIDLTNTGGSINLVATESTANALRFNASGVAGGLDIDSGTGGFIVDTTGAISLDAAAASNFTATGAFDLTLASTLGRVVVNAEQAAADALRLLSVAGGLDANVALQMNLDSSQAAATAVRIVASNAGGGIDIDAGTTGIAIDTTGALSLDAAAASNLTVTGAFDLTVNSTLGRLVLNSEQAAADALRVVSVAGGLDANVALQMNLDSSQAAATAVRIVASNAAGGIDIDSGTGGITVDSTGVLSLDSAGATNLTATGAFDVTVNSTAGSVIVNGGEAVLDAIQITNGAAGGGIDINGGTAGITVDTTGALSLDSAAASNFTVTGAFDLTLDSSAGSVNVTGAEAATDAVKISASNAAGGITLDFGAQIGCILTDGTSTARLMVYSTSPVGVITAPKGSICIDVGTPNIWQNDAGGNAWTAH